MILRKMRFAIFLACHPVQSRPQQAMLFSPLYYVNAAQKTDIPLQRNHLIWIISIKQSRNS